MNNPVVLGFGGSFLVTLGFASGIAALPIGDVCIDLSAPLAVIGLAAGSATIELTLCDE